MLQSSNERLTRLSPDLRSIAEEMAEAIMMSELGENLIANDEALKITKEHREAQTEEWHRTVNAAVSSLLVLHQMGYALTRN